ncbi:MAG TPA: glycosyltransferase family 2 protein [Rickettsiales bacterium]|nr:glycosyltransferase family 2 protein [Rickettsiales bacterium]
MTHASNGKTVNYAREVLIARVCVAATLLLYVGVFQFIIGRGHDFWRAGQTGNVIEAAVFAIAMFFMAYGNVLYQVCMVGYYKRQKKHVPAPREELNALYGRANPPTLSILIPSYKEEYGVMWQTMMSAALSEYPAKDIVLLIDDPYHTKTLADSVKLEEARLLPGRLQNVFDAYASRFRLELDAFRLRKEAKNVHAGVELNRIAILYEEVAAMLAIMAKDFMAGRRMEEMTHTERFFVQSVLQAPMHQYDVLAKELRGQMIFTQAPSDEFFEQHYARLAGLFNVKFSSFERKKYCNLSHEANKAMNLNSYIALVGKSWKEVQTEKGLELHEAPASEATFTIPHRDYINTIDADSLMLSDYLIRMVEMMERPENDRLAVLQSSVSSVPDSPNMLERTAGACLDLQFMNHQGFTYWGATFWVGANAMLRFRALQDIKESKLEDGKQVTVYIQDRTVIEDTESTVDLVEKGWKLHNYPDRMSYSAMPADFGSLLIQRRRWANGGMIILPKLFSYVAKAPKNLALLKEFFMRFHYLAATTIGCAVIAMLSLYNFGDNMATLWIMLSIIPGSLLYLRTLVISGYRAGDIFRISALNLMLIPVLFGGVFKQFEQMLTGKKIPFGRTPKVTGRTAAPAIYCWVEVIMTAAFCAITVNDVIHHVWFHAIFTASNAACMLYAMFSFMGIKATLEDMFSGVLGYWKTFSRQADIIPITVMRQTKDYILPESRRVS